MWNFEIVWIIFKKVRALESIYSTHEKNKIFGNFVENIDISIQHKEKILFKSAFNISLLYLYYYR